jgi:predicted nucleic acid-binding protein
MKRIAFIDAGVLIAASRGNQEVSSQAMQELDDPECEYAASAFVQLETLPKPAYEGLEAETAFYDDYFAAVKHWAAVTPELVEEALREGKASGLDAVDALHVSAARILEVDELVTTERPSKPLHRTKRVKVRSIQPTT